MTTANTYRTEYEACLRSGDLAPGVSDADVDGHADAVSATRPRREATDDEIMDFCQTTLFEMVRDEGAFIDEEGFDSTPAHDAAFGKALGERYREWAKAKGVF